MSHSWMPYTSFLCSELNHMVIFSLGGQGKKASFEEVISNQKSKW